MYASLPKREYKIPNLQSIFLSRTQLLSLALLFACRVIRFPVLAIMLEVGSSSSIRPKWALLNGILVNNCLCAVQLDGYVRANRSRLKCRCLFIVSALFLETKKRIPLGRLRNLRSADTAVAPGDFNP